MTAHVPGHTLASLILATEVGRMLGCIRSMAVIVSQVPNLVDMTGKAAVKPVSSMAACGALFACGHALVVREGTAKPRQNPLKFFNFLSCPAMAEKMLVCSGAYSH